jgi:hypothetical protein
LFRRLDPAFVLMRVELVVVGDGVSEQTHAPTESHGGRHVSCPSKSVGNGLRHPERNSRRDGSECGVGKRRHDLQHQMLNLGHVRDAALVRDRRNRHRLRFVTKDTKESVVLRKVTKCLQIDKAGSNTDFFCFVFVKVGGLSVIKMVLLTIQ